jgi:acyl-CoA dehydrogenase
MNEDRALLAETAAKALRELPDDFAQAWKRIADAGFALLLVPETVGGFGGGWEDANVVLRAAGAATANLPLAETIIANGILAAAGVEITEGIVSVAPTAEGTIAEGRFTGQLRGVPFGDTCNSIVAEIDNNASPHIVSLSRQDAEITRDYRNIAGEPRADLKFSDAEAAIARRPGKRDLLHLGALARTCQIAGALDTTLAMTIEHAKTRQQFGRAIGNFQAIQQQLAVFASETAAVGAAAASACRAADRGDVTFEIASAKLRANRAVDIATSAAHQIHGAIGITAEHALHRYTQRLWAWKSEYGNDRFWAKNLGSEIAAKGADSFWPALTQA